MDRFFVFHSRVYRAVSEVRLYEETIAHIKEQHPEIPIEFPAMLGAIESAVTNPTSIEANHPGTFVFVDRRMWFGRLKMGEQVALSVTYDRESDVLYIHTASEPAASAVEDESGIVWRSGAAGKVIGATVVGFDEFWSDKPASLAAILADRVPMPLAEAVSLVARALG